MKTLSLLLTALCLGALPVGGQILLNTGDSFAYQFSTLPLVMHIPSSFPGPFGGLAFDVQSGSWQLGTILRYEMFETSTSDAPIFVGTLDEPPATQVAVTVPNGWQDLQGAVRFTVLSGSVAIEDATVGAFVLNDLGLLDRYETIVPVPEPSVLALLLAGLVFVFIGRGLRSRLLAHQ